ARGRHRGPRARRRARARRGRDGARRQPSPARVGSARTAVAGAQHGPRRLPASAGQHPRSPQPLDPPLVREPARPLRRGGGGPRAVPVDDAARSSARVSSTRAAPSGGSTEPDSAHPGDDGGSPGGAPPRESFASGARILTIGIASTGIFTFLYLAIASNVLQPAEYSRISLCWAIMFVILSVIYRPIEQ